MANCRYRLKDYMGFRIVRTNGYRYFATDIVTETIHLVAYSRKDIRKKIEEQRKTMSIFDKIDIKVTRYQHGNYYIDIIETKEEYEAWLQDNTMGVSLFMFGLPKKGHKVCEFIYVIEQFIEEYEEAYRKDVE